MDDDRFFAVRLVNELVEAGATQSAVARAIGVDQSLITRWRQGRKQPGGYALYKLARLHQIVVHFGGKAA